VRFTRVTKYDVAEGPGASSHFDSVMHLAREARQIVCFRDKNIARVSTAAYE
jgi:hypothetical protein